MGTRRTRRQARGFSLVEMAVVTLLIGIFLTMGLAAFRATQESQAVSQTINKQNAIKDALIGYLRRNGRLPCADIDFAAPDGIENRSTAGSPTTPCATTPSNARFGIVPYATLGLARDAAVDGWGNFFSYQVSNAFPPDTFTPPTNPPGNYNPTPNAPNRDWTLALNLRSGNMGELTVNDRDAAGTVFAAATSVVAVIVSHGPNGFGAYTISGTRNSLPGGVDELENTNGDTTYVRRTATTDDAATGGAFDDRVMFLTADDLLGPLFKDGSVKPPAARISDTFQLIENAIARYALVHPNGYYTPDCSSTVNPPTTSNRCRMLPYADLYYGNGAQNPGVWAAEVPYADLGLGQYDIWDPWGRPILYSVNTTSLTTSGIGSTGPAGANLAYTLTSFGPDRNPGGGDDFSVTVTVTDLRNSLTGVLP